MVIGTKINDIRKYILMYVVNIGTYKKQRTPAGNLYPATVIGASSSLARNGAVGKSLKASIVAA